MQWFNQFRGTVSVIFPAGVEGRVCQFKVAPIKEIDAREMGSGDLCWWLLRRKSNETPKGGKAIIYIIDLYISISEAVMGTSKEIDAVV